MDKSADFYQKRINTLLNILNAHSTDGFVCIKHPHVNQENLRYLSGFTGSSACLIISGDHRILVTDDRYTDQAARQCPDYTIVDHCRRPGEKFEEILSTLSLKKVAFETQGMTVDLFNGFIRQMPDIKWVSTTGMVESLRAVKSKQEIETMKIAADIAVQAFHHTVKQIRPGVTEKDLAMEMEWHMRQNGAEDAAFHTILVSGERGASQHGVPSDKKIESGDFIVIDFGARYQGYLSDITRTIAMGPVSKKHRRVYDAVKKAQAHGVEMLRAGVHTGDIYNQVQSVIAGEGFGEYAGTGIGHSVGLTLWEDPGIKAGENTSLKTGNVLTMEPGIYIPGWGGVRIEDMVVIEENGHRILSDLPRDLMIL